MMLSLGSGADGLVQFSPGLLTFAATVVVVTASGALMPGPLFAACLLQGTKGGAKSGFIMSVGHTFVELPLVLLLGVGISSLLNLSGFLTLVGLIGGSALVIFGILQLRYVTRGNLITQPIDESKARRSSLVLGVGLTGLNPYFIVWWLTFGLGLVVQAVEFGALLGVLFMYVSHVWMDYAWLTSTAYLSARGKTILKAKGYRLLLIALALILMYFGVGFILRTIFQFNILP
jgi:threonine/homoserine/homoserine lactone efflux protein